MTKQGLLNGTDPELDPDQQRRRGRQEISAIAAGWIIAMIATIAIGNVVLGLDYELDGFFILGLWLPGLVLWIRVAERRWLHPLGPRSGTGMSRLVGIAFGLMSLGLLIGRSLWPPVIWLQLDSDGLPVYGISVPPNQASQIVFATATVVALIVVAQAFTELWRDAGHEQARTAAVDKQPELGAEVTQPPD